MIKKTTKLILNHLERYQVVNIMKMKACAVGSFRISFNCREHPAHLAPGTWASLHPPTKPGRGTKAQTLWPKTLTDNTLSRGAGQIGQGFVSSPSQFDFLLYPILVSPFPPTGVNP